MKFVIVFAFTIFISTGSTIKVGSYFKFDEVEHFETDYKKYEQESESIYFKSAKNQQEEDLLNVLLSEKTSFQDTVLIKKLEELGFVNQKYPQVKSIKLENYLSQKNPE
jgi:hypothetical protein